MPYVDLTEASDSVQKSPHWVLGFVRYKVRATFDRSHTTDSEMSFTVAKNNVSAERKPIVTDAAQSLQVSANKGSHVTTMSANLPPDLNYLTHVFPGDWVFAWIVDGKDKADALMADLRSKKTASGLSSGIKFVGKVQSVTARTSVNRSTGVIDTMYQLAAAGFSEFDSTVFYLPQVTQSQVEPVFLKFLGVAFNEILKAGSETSKTVTKSTTARTIVPDKMVAACLSVLFGVDGPFANAATIANLGTGDSLRQAPRQSYLVPDTVFKWLGLEGKSYSDVLQLMTGLQKYSTSKASSDLREWMPTNKDAAPGLYKNHLKYGEVLGDFSVVPPPMNTTVWSMLANYLNSPINEMYVALKPIWDGKTTKILPTLTYRQNPFSSERAVKVRETGERVETTRFLELPTWKVSGKMIYDQSITRSNAGRINYLTVFGTPTQSQDLPNQLINNVPNQDSVDILRNGVRPYIANTNCVVQEWLTGPQSWKALMSDIVMGEHLTLSGSMVLDGIYAPIAPGDNLESNGIVYHIENVNHSCSISPGTGQTQFQTTVGLSHGVNNQAAMKAMAPNTIPTTEMYPAIENTADYANDAVTQEGLTVEGDKKVGFTFDHMEQTLPLPKGLA